jgi:glucose/arabinose dehydrogenase
MRRNGAICASPVKGSPQIDRLQSKRPLLIALVCLVVLLTACSKSTARGGTPTHAATPTATATIPPTGPLATVKLSLTPVVRGLMRPDFLTTAHDGTGRLYIAEQSGLIRVAEANGKLYSEPFLDVLTRWDVELGLLGLAFHPQFKQNGLFFIAYSNLDGDTVISRYHIEGNNPLRADPGSAQVIVVIQQPRPVRPEHKAGMLLFGPDGYLYVGVGDGGLGAPSANGQRLDTFLGKILRIDVDHTSAGKAYAIPTTNPVNAAKGIPTEIWAYGLRNPWRFSFDRLTHNLYIGDVGELAYEEVDFQPASSKGGENYGWSLLEGPECAGSSCAPPGYVAPIAYYRHGGDVCALAGGYVYRGKASPALRGIYVYGDWCSGRIFGLNTDGNAPGKPAQVRQLLDTNASISSFGEDDAGEVYVLDLHAGIAYRLTAR